MLDRLRDTLCSETPCSSKCTDMLLGSLIRQMHQAGISRKRVKRPFYGYSVDGLKESLSAFTSPKFYPEPKSNNSCSCRLEYRIQPLLEKSLEDVEDLGLENVWKGRLEQRESKRNESSALRTEWRSASECSTAV